MMSTVHRPQTTDHGQQSTVHRKPPTVLRKIWQSVDRRLSTVAYQLSSVNCRLSTAWRSQAGYTIIELVIAMVIFMIIMLVAVASYVNVSQSANKTTAQRHVQQDARYNEEEIARQTRSSSIDYAFYTVNATDARCNVVGRHALALFVTESGTGATSVTRRLIFFYRQADDNDPSKGGALYRYTNSEATVTPTCDDIYNAPTHTDNNPNQSQLTADNVLVSSANFFITPDSDPYNRTPCGPGDTPCKLARNTHPRVTIVLTVQSHLPGTGVTSQSSFSSATVETTVGSRAYPQSVLVGQPT